MGIDYKAKNRHKIFCIGLNKTGTTSLGYLFEKNGITVAKQYEGELLFKAYLNRDFSKIVKYCKKSKATVFQDIPFSLPHTFPFLFDAFPNSKFILTIRDTPEKWYDSLVKFHSDFYNNGRPLTKEILKESEYVYKGWSWEVMNDVFFRDYDVLYDKKSLIDIYTNHIKSVEHFFRNHKERLLIVNLSVEGDFKRLCDFLKITIKDAGFPKITSMDLINLDYNCEFLKVKK